MGNEGKVYFCKFSTRSPKDSVAIKNTEEEITIATKLLIKNQSLKVTNGVEALNLLTRSQRIFSDIALYFQYHLKGSHPPLHKFMGYLKTDWSLVGTTSGRLSLILRDWVEGIRPDLEFRCYVYNKKLTAISQYNCYCKFENLQVSFLTQILKNLTNHRIGNMWKRSETRSFAFMMRSKT